MVASHSRGQSGFATRRPWTEFSHMLGEWESTFGRQWP